MGRATALVVSVVGSLAAAFAAARWAEVPMASVPRGSEEAFAREGLYPRELAPRRLPLRWTFPSSEFRFRFLPNVGHSLHVAVHGHRAGVLVTANGASLGLVEPGSGTLDADLPPSPTVTIGLQTTGFAAGGRKLGAQLEEVRIGSEPGPPSAALLGLFLLAALGVVATALWCGIAPPTAALLSLGVSSLQAAALLPSGILFSAAALAASLGIAASAVLSGVFARRFAAEARPWAFLAALTACLLLGLLPLHPVLVVGDAVFHANKLHAVAGGDFFPTSQTQHDPPFRFPYGVSFYLLLSPFVRLGADGVESCRVGAALSSVLSALGLFALVARRSPRSGALAVAVLALLPGTLQIQAYGNLSNVFAEAMSALFFCWWAGGSPGGVALGTALFVLAALGHFSSFVVLLILGPALALLGTKDPRRLAALAIGLALSVAYYGSFLGLVAEQLPRLVSGGGGGGRGLGSAFLKQAHDAWTQWGAPAILLGLLGRPRSREGEEADCRAYWIAGALLGLLAVVSPLDVRYLYALSLPLSIAAAAGLEKLPAAAAGLLLAGQALLAGREALLDVLHRYRGTP